jgi:hypothetical protein
VAALVLLSPLLSGCVQYYYMGKTYGSEDEVLAVQTDLYERAIARIPRLSAPIAPRARFAIPSRDVVHEEAIYGPSPGGREWLTNLLDRELQYTAEAIIRRGIFTKLMVEETDGGHLVLRPSEIGIYLYLESPSVLGWYFQRGNGPRTPIFFESGKADFAARIMFFLNSIERLVVQDQSNAVEQDVAPVKAVQPTP